MKINRIDNGGIKGYVKEVKLMTNVDWDDIFSKITDQETTICTYGDPDNQYNPFFRKHLPHMKNLMLVLGCGPDKNKKSFFESKVRALNPNIKLYLKWDTHAKVVLIAPDEVYISSQNVGISDWFQVTAYIKDKDMYKQYKENVDNYALNGQITKLYRREKNKKSTGKTWVCPKKLNPLPTASHKIVRYVECKASHMYNWNQKFNNIKDRNFIISTYSLPNDDYLVRMIRKLLDYNNTVTLVANSKFKEAADSLKKEVNNKNFTIELRPDLHAKMVLCSNNSVWLGSHNFGDSTWFEEMIQFVRNKDVHDFYYNEFMKYMNKDEWKFTGYIRKVVDSSITMPITA